MSIGAGELAARCGAVCEGEAAVRIDGVASIDVAGPSDVAFFTGRGDLLRTTRAGAIFLDAGEVPRGTLALRTPRPRLAFARAAALLFPEAHPEPGVHPLASVDATACVDGAAIEAFAVIGPRAVVAPGAWVQAHAVLGADVEVGTLARIFPHAVILDGCRVGARARIGPGAIIGFDGFGFEVEGGEVVRVPHRGTVVIEDDAEIGANACVDRGTLGATRVEHSAKLDNLVHIAHNAVVGARSLLAAFAGLAGGAQLGADARLGGRASLVDGVKVGANTTLSAMAAVARDEGPGQHLSGAPARPHRQWLRELAALRALPGYLRDRESR
jgi:UDP-3-O-[3-hydroxymyristoyl] glucosamine N-acyltransferase